MWGAPTWRAGYDGIQHPGLCLRFDERLPRTGVLSLRIKETKDMGKVPAAIKFCNVKVGDAEHRADVVSGSGEVKWNSKLDFTLEGEEEFVNVALFSDDAPGPKVLCTSIIPITELLAAIHPTMPLPPSDDHKDKLAPLKADCKSLHAALQHTSALPDHLKEAITELIAGAYIDPPRHDAWFSLYDDKFTLVGLVNLCFYFTPSHYPTPAPRPPVLVDPKAKHAKPVKSWFRKSTTEATPPPAKREKYYGVTVEEATMQSGGAIPVPLAVLTDYLATEGLVTEGLFRVAGSKTNIDAIVDAFKHDSQPILTDVHDAAGALKAFFRQMPEPVIPFSHYDGFIGIAGDIEQSVEEKKTLFSSMVQNLPAQNIAVVKHLMVFLNKIAAHSESNLMTADNLAIVFAPNLLKPEDDDAKLLVSDAALAHQAIAMIIKYAQEILPPEQVVVESSLGDFLGAPHERHSVLTVRRSSLDHRPSVSTNPVQELAKAISDLESLRADVGIARGKQAAAEGEREKLREEVQTVKKQWMEELEDARAEMESMRREGAEAQMHAEREHTMLLRQKEDQYQKLLADNTTLMTEMSTQAKETAAVVAKLRAQREEEAAQAQVQIARMRQEVEDGHRAARDYSKTAEQLQVELKRVQGQALEDAERLHRRVTELSTELETLKAESAAESKRQRVETERAQDQINEITKKAMEEKNAIMAEFQRESAERDRQSASVGLSLATSQQKLLQAETASVEAKLDAEKLRAQISEQKAKMEELESAARASKEQLETKLISVNKAQNVLETKYKEAEVELVQLRAHNVELSTTSERRVADMKALSESFASTQLVLEKTTSEMNNLKAETLASHTQFNEFKAAAASAAREATIQKQALETRIVELQQKVLESNAHSATTSNQRDLELKEVQAKFSAVTQQLQQANLLLQEKEQELLKERETSNQLTQKALDLQQTVESSNMQVKEIEKQLERERKNFSSNEEAWNIERTTQKQNVSSMDTKCLQLEQRLKEVLEDAKEQQQHESEERKRITELLLTEQTNLVKVREEKSGVEASLRLAKEDLSKLSLNYKESVAKLTIEQENRQQLNENLSELKEATEKRATHVEDLEHEREKLSLETNQYQQAVASLQTNVELLEQQLSQAKAHGVAYDKLVIELENERKRLVEDLKAEQDVTTKLREENSQFMLEIAEIDQVNIAYKKIESDLLTEKAKSSVLAQNMRTLEEIATQRASQLEHLTELQHKVGELSLWEAKQEQAIIESQNRMARIDQLSAERKQFEDALIAEREYSMKLKEEKAGLEDALQLSQLLLEQQRMAISAETPRVISLEENNVRERKVGQFDMLSPDIQTKELEHSLDQAKKQITKFEAELFPNDDLLIERQRLLDSLQIAEQKLTFYGDLESRHTQLEATLQTLDEELTEAKSEIAKLVLKAHLLGSELQQSNAETTQLKEALMAEQQKLSTAENRIQKLSEWDQKAGAVDHTLSEVKTELAELERESQQMHDEFARESLSRQRVAEELSFKSRLQVVFAQQKQQLETKVEHLDRSLAEANFQIGILEAKVNNLESELKKTTTSHSLDQVEKQRRLSHKISDDLVELESKTVMLELHLKDSKEHVQNLESKAEFMDSELKRETALREQLERSLLEARQVCRMEYLAKIETLETKLAQLTQDSERDVQERDNAFRDLQIVRQKLFASSTSLETAQIEAHEAKVALKLLQESVVDSSQNNRGVEASNELEQMRVQLVDLQVAHETAATEQRRTIEELTNQLTSLRSQHELTLVEHKHTEENLHSRLTSLQTDYDAATASRERIEGALQVRIADLQKQHGNVVAELQVVKEAQKSTQEQLLAQQQLRMQAQMEISAAITKREQPAETHASRTRLAPKTEGAIIEAVSAYIDEQAEVVIQTGELEKRSSGFPKRWQARQCTLTSRKLSWVSPHKHSVKTILGLIDLVDMRSAAPSGDGGFVVYVHGREGVDRVFEFEATDSASRDSWVASINAALVKAQRAKGKPEPLADVLRRVTQDGLEAVTIHPNFNGERKTPYLSDPVR